MDTERAKEWISRALLIDPDNMNMRYNFACALTMLGETGAAIDTLKPVFETTYIDRLNHAKVDPDLNPLRADPRFQSMMAQAEARLAADGATFKDWPVPIVLVPDNHPLPCLGSCGRCWLQ